jgi:ABC-type dipeptide/oligopeptide/nickel transport system ATPase subunit
MDQRETIDNIELDHSLFLNKCTSLIGPSKTGKTTVIKYIIKILRNYVDQIVIICPTDASSPSYSQFIPSVWIHYTLTKELLDDFYERQVCMSKVYNVVNKFEVLEKLFNRLDLPNVQRYISQINQKRTMILAELMRLQPNKNGINKKAKEINDRFTEMLRLLYKKFVSKNRDYLMRISAELSQDEQYSLKNIDINPNSILIFDDATTELKQFKNNPIISKLFYQGRHLHISTLMVVHAHNILPPALRTGAHNIIFTDYGQFQGFHSSSSNNFSKEMQHRALNAARQTFVKDEKYKHQKILYIREKDKYYKFTAIEDDDFQFFTGSLKRFFDTLSNINDDSLPDDTNKFSKCFN